ncbi:hypothetical protein COLO4_15193 [Corchorus olitorius]|uniref:Uncharacterized protein n=1 Tax=Corchorus olitorius TaxID=93759 RepID=A0A1R3JP66_9ROSI|nr:hypothetical protein COLO4_15193 [Corchorus olitorius]
MAASPRIWFRHLGIYNNIQMIMIMIWMLHAACMFSVQGEAKKRFPALWSKHWVGTDDVEIRRQDIEE